MLWLGQNVCCRFLEKVWMINTFFRWGSRWYNCMSDTNTIIDCLNDWRLHRVYVVEASLFLKRLARIIAGQPRAPPHGQIICLQTVGQSNFRPMTQGPCDIFNLAQESELQQTYNRCKHLNMSLHLLHVRSLMLRLFCLFGFLSRPLIPKVSKFTETTTHSVLGPTETAL